ncbi:MAG: hypothetical protein DMF08_04550 [Verrucomicrobia bacterium]|nr:MAG: hypothetical protein DMF08_04550 [Verrucomicrobiota bacterium]PYL22489.1 MAG: hypothetical protein DMF44_10850 [Verrucomicrobiota bacterium]
MIFQISEDATDFSEAPFYLRRICETCSDAPPNPSHAYWQREFLLQLCKNGRIVVRVEERQCQSKPLRVGCYRK